jgi:hypothetical protein
VNSKKIPVCRQLIRDGTDIKIKEYTLKEGERKIYPQQEWIVVVLSCEGHVKPKEMKSNQEHPQS